MRKGCSNSVVDRFAVFCIPTDVRFTTQRIMHRTELQLVHCDSSIWRGGGEENKINVATKIVCVNLADAYSKTPISTLVLQTIFFHTILATMFS